MELEQSPNCQSVIGKEGKVERTENYKHLMSTYIRQTSSLADMDIWAKKNLRKICSKNGLTWPEIALKT